MKDEIEPIDVDALVADLKRRVERKKAQGLYSVDALAVDALDGTEPVHAEDLERLRPMAAVHVEVGVAASDKPVLGRALSPLKRRLVKGVSQPLFGIADQAGRFNAGLLAYTARLGREVARQNTRADDAEARATEAAGRAEVLSRELAALRESMAELSRRLQIIETTSRKELSGAQSPAAGVHQDAGRAAALGLILEERHPVGDQGFGWTRLSSSAEAPVLHVGAGSGKNLSSLGNGAFGVDPDPELATAARREGRAVTAADPQEFVAGLTPGSLGGALITGVTERLDGRQLLALLSDVRSALRSDAPVVVVANGDGTSVTEERVWEDPLAVRPFPPGALIALADAAGLADTHVGDAPDGPSGEPRYCLRAKG